MNLSPSLTVNGFMRGVKWELLAICLRKQMYHLPGTSAELGPLVLVQNNHVKIHQPGGETSNYECSELL